MKDSNSKKDHVDNKSKIDKPKSNHSHHEKVAAGSMWNSLAASDNQIGVQRKCSSCGGDVYEQQADVVADKVSHAMNNPSQYSESVNVMPYRRSTQRKCSVCENEEESVQTKKDSNSNSENARSSVSSLIHFPPAGASVEPSIQSTTEQVTGHDLSYARVHTDAASNNAAASINARAFTYGNHIFMGAGESTNDAKLMSHELTHVAQQSSDRSIQKWEGEEESSEAASTNDTNQAEDHTFETKPEFEERVKARAIQRLARNIIVLEQWKSYIESMEGFQLRAQLLAGLALDYANNASTSLNSQERFEEWSGTDSSQTRAFQGAMLASDSTYRERSNSFMGHLSGRVNGYWATASVANRSQVLVGDRLEDSLPQPVWVPPDPRYSAYTGAIRRYESGESGGCQTCHDINYAWQQTTEIYGTGTPMGRPTFPDFSDFAILSDGANNDVNTQVDDSALLYAWIASNAPALADTAQNPLGSRTNSVESNRFVPNIDLPEAVELPAPRTNLCGPLPDAGSEANASDNFNPASWGENSAIVADMIGRIGAVLAPLGPRGYQVIDRQNFDSLWSIEPEGDSLESVRSNIISNIDTKQENYRSLQGRISEGITPYHNLCPIVDELLPTTNALVQFSVRQQIREQQAIETLTETLDWVLLALAFIYPPSIIATLPLRAGLGLAKIAIGSDQVRRGTDFNLGQGAGVFSPAQEAAADSLETRGNMNMLGGALDLFFMGVGRLTTQKPPSMFEDELILRGWRRSSLPNRGTMWTHTDYPGTIWREGDAFEFVDGSFNTIGRLEFTGRGASFTPTMGAPNVASPPPSGVGLPMLPQSGAVSGQVVSPLQTYSPYLPVPTSRLFLPSPNRTFLVGGSASRLGNGTFPGNINNPCGRGDNCGFTSVSYALQYQYPTLSVIGADRLYAEHLERLGLAPDSLSQQLVFPDRLGTFDGVASRSGYDALFSNGGNRLSEYTVIRVARENGLIVTQQNDALRNFNIAWRRPDLDEAADLHFESLSRRQGLARTPDFDRVYDLLETYRETLPGLYIIGSRQSAHYMTMTLHPNGTITGFDPQSFIHYDNLNQILARVQNPRFLLRIEAPLPADLPAQP